MFLKLCQARAGNVDGVSSDRFIQEVCRDLGGNEDSGAESEGTTV